MTVHRRPRNRQSGFTMIEVLVALSVTVIGLVGLMSLHTSVLKGNRASSSIAEATAIAQLVMEEHRSMRLDTSEPGSLAAVYGPLPITNQILDPVNDRNSMTGRPGIARPGMTYVPVISAWELDNVAEDLVMLRVEVFWAEDGADNPLAVPAELKHSVAVELVRTRQEGL